MVLENLFHRKVSIQTTNQQKKGGELHKQDNNISFDIYNIFAA